MLYPNLQINISKKRGASGLDDSSATLINTPVILDLAVQMSDEKSFAFSHQAPSLNQFTKHERSLDEKQINNLQTSLQTPILDINQTPFFNHTTSNVSPGDQLTDFVPPNDVLNTYTTASSSTSTTNTYNDLNQSLHLPNSIQLSVDQSNHPLNMQSKLLSSKQQQDSNIQNNYHQFTTSAYTVSANQINQYTSNVLNHQTTDLNDNQLNALNHHHSHLTSQHDQQQPTYTELKSSNHQPQLLIPNSVYDISGGYNKNKQQHALDQPPSYISPSSPTESSTSSSNLDRDQDSLYTYNDSHHLNRSTRRYPGQQSSSQSEAKKSRMTKKQKYDAMVNEEKSLLRNNEQLKNDIKELEDMIVRYKNTIMNTVKTNK